MTTQPATTIRRECLQPALYWARPTGAEMQEVLRLADFPGWMAAYYLDLADESGRQIRRWISGEADIPYSAWALLCHAAGLGQIWQISPDEMRKARPRSGQADHDNNRSSRT